MSLTKDHIIDLQLEFLPAYADHILEKHLDEYVQLLYDFSMELDIPLMKFFSGVPKAEIIKLSLDGARQLLSAVRDRSIDAYVEQSRNNWLRNQLPQITREDVIVEDISLINYARKRVLRELLPTYSKDTGSIIKIIDEIDRFILTLDATLVKTYLTIQEERLRKSNEQLQRRERELLEAQALGKIGSFDWDLTGNRNSAYTPEMFKIFEMEETSNLESFLNDVHPEDRSKLQGAIEKAMHDGVYECEYRYQRKNIQKVLHSRGKVFFEKDRPIRLVGTVTDVTEKANMIKQLQESDALSKQAQALTNTGSWKWIIDNDTIEWSDEMYRIYGLTPQSEKITFQRFLQFIHDEDRTRRVAEITEAVNTGKASDYIMRIMPQGGTEKVLKGKGQVLVDKAGKSIGMLGTCQDITKEYALTSELKRKNSELLRKNKELESFNFIASHDLQEPLRKIQIYSSRIVQEDGVELPANVRKFFEKITSASNRMQKMIGDFLMFYHAMESVERVEKIDFSQIVSEACESLSAVIEKKQAQLKVDGTIVLEASRPHMIQMLTHLISNAVKFNRQGVRPEVTISGRADVLVNGKKYTVLSVTDNGIGFEQKYSDRIFELFQRLNASEEYPGSGIGLSLCKKIAEDHKGYIAVASEPGKGSTFSVYLPAKQE